VFAALVLWACCALSACRITRSPKSPFVLDAGQNGAKSLDSTAGRGGSAGTIDAAPAMTSGASGMGSLAGTSATGGARAGAAGTAGTAGTAGDTLESDAAVSSDAGGSTCMPADAAVCNPVTNEGCPDSMQCAVDGLSDVLAGYCIFSTPMPDAGFCFNSGVTESCPPKQTCVVDQCRTLCFCDADCEEKQCCVESIGTVGFKVCGAC
jgi:hypothetical protein